MLFFHLNRLF